MPDVLRDYQEEALFGLFDYFDRGMPGNPLIGLPTGTGKSLVIAESVRRIFQWWPTQRVMMLTHVKELIEQNAKKLLNQWPSAPIGIYSAGLNSRDMHMPIVFGGVQSVANAIMRDNKANADGLIRQNERHFGHRDLLFVDEAHLISSGENTMYQFVISELRKINPYMRVIGLSATLFRMKQGLLTEGDDALFTDVAFDLTNMDGFNRLLAQGYMSPLVARHTDAMIDTSKVGTVAGEFNQKQLEQQTDRPELIYKIVRETITKSAGREHGLYFAAGIDNAEHVAAVFQEHGINAYAVHSKLKSKVNDERIEAFVRGDIPWITNNGKLTTGFDFPPIDVIAFGRATMSPGLWVQMAGRGTRPWPGKWNCMGLDFARNRVRLGPINDPRKPRPKGKGGGDMPVRICDQCGTYNHASARFCELCGYEFAITTKLLPTAGTQEFIKGDSVQIETFPVSKVIYRPHLKMKNGIQVSPPMIRVSYICGLREFNEYVTLEHPGLAGHRAREWWRQRFNGPVPVTTHEALLQTSYLRCPVHIRVNVAKDYPEILGCEF
jgi:DNA repair protein RadD